MLILLPARGNGAPQILVRGAGGTYAENTAAMHPAGTRLYIGKRYSTDEKRLNLLVYTVNTKGELEGEPRRYRDSALPLPENSRSSISVIVPDARYKKLYLAYGLDGKGVTDENRFISVYDLNDQGEPTGTARSYFSGNPRKVVNDMVVHPHFPVLYIGGWGSEAIHYYRLDEKGEPQGLPETFRVGRQGKYQLRLSADGKRLYAGSYPDLLEVIELDDEGIPTGTPRSFTAGEEKSYLKFEYSPRALFLLRESPTGPHLAIWPLDGKGDPIGKPQVREDIPASTVAMDAARHILWVGANDVFKDTFSGKTLIQGTRAKAFEVTSDGTLKATGIESSLAFRQKGLTLAATNGNAFLLTEPMPRGVLGNRVRDYRIRATLISASASDEKRVTSMNLSVGLFNKGATIRWPDISPHDSTPWNNLDDLLKDKLGQQVLVVTAPNNITHLAMRFEIAQGDPAQGGSLLQILTDEVEGNRILLLLPGYGFDPPEERVAAMETFTDHAAKYLAAARTVGLKADERPRLFPVSAHQLLGGQGSLKQLERQAETVALLGFNTINAYWWGNISPTAINSILNKHGLQRRTSAIYKPPSYFAYDEDSMNSLALMEWAKQFPPRVAETNGAAPTNVVTHYLADEPGWYFPSRLNEVKDKPQRLENFRAYLKGKGFTPADFGCNGWNEVFPIGASTGAREDAPLPTRRLFYWTMRFFPESSARAFRMATDAVRQVYNHPIDTPVNWNNWISTWYIPSPNKKIGNNSVIDPDSAMGSMDWFEAGRQSSNTLWSEDWFGDQNAQAWSLYADVLRSASMLGTSRFGGYVIGVSTGGFAAGAKYKILSLLGHGGKSLDMFTFGPEPLFPGNCWSEGFHKYGSIAGAMRLVAQSERLLFPGQPERGKVAILVPSISRLWEHQSRPPLYQQEIYGLHAALIHMGYTVDFVDNVELSTDAWRKRGYTTLYITEPNIATDAQSQIVTWAREGGTLVATPGAGVADEYNTASSTLDPVLGLQNRAAVRDYEFSRGVSAVNSQDERFPAVSIQNTNAVMPFNVTTAKPLALLADGSSGIVANAFGKGRAVSYNFFPGCNYSNSADRSDRSQLPQNWDSALRHLITAPVQIAGTMRPITCSVEEIEAVRLSSEKGIAVTLLNWKGIPVESLKITVPNAGQFSKVSAASGHPIKSTFKGNTLEVEMTLPDVDVLLIE